VQRDFGGRQNHLCGVERGEGDEGGGVAGVGRSAVLAREAFGIGRWMRCVFLGTGGMVDWGRCFAGGDCGGIGLPEDGPSICSRRGDQPRY